MFEYFGLEDDKKSESVSVGGWVLEQLGKIAEEGDTFTYENLSVVVTKVDQRRIIEISVNVLDTVKEDENEDDAEKAED